MKQIFAALAAACVIATSSGAFAMSPAQSMNTDLGPVLADSKGMTLYTFRKDKPGKSVCNGQCAALWPPLTAADGAMADGDYSVITRDDGSKQWAYKGMALYGWVKDKKPGDTTGNGVKGIWDVARP
tara:strand:- start:645 stop:1025 length:381 start_codon:yes stop_codon:yes gene_type:complete